MSKEISPGPSGIVSITGTPPISVSSGLNPVVSSSDGGGPGGGDPAAISTVLVETTLASTEVASTALIPADARVICLNVTVHEVFDDPTARVSALVYNVAGSTSLVDSSDVNLRLSGTTLINELPSVQNTGPLRIILSGTNTTGRLTIFAEYALPAV